MLTNLTPITHMAFVGLLIETLVGGYQRFLVHNISKNKAKRFVLSKLAWLIFRETL